MRSLYFLFLIMPGILMAQNPVSKDSVAMTGNLKNVTILGGDQGLLTHLPGSVTQIDQKQLNEMMPHSGNEVLKRVPGLHVVEEEGAGMRINIGIRGLDPDRSRTLLIMEDGIPVSLNPYGENEMYYTPQIDRMSGVEVLKGSGQVLYGPQTIGGVVNYLTADAPEKPSLKLRFMGGSGLNFNGFASFGTTYKNTGIVISYLRRQAENMGPLRFRVDDVNVKFNFKLSQKSNLLFKAAYFNEVSNATYIGITQTMYDAGGQDFVRLAPDDKLNVKRFSGSAIYSLKISPKWEFKAIAFAYQTTRNWRRQDFLLQPGANMSGVVWGDSAVSGGAIFMQNSTTHRNRTYQVWGAETKVGGTFRLGRVHNRLDAGIRYVGEDAIEAQLRGGNPQAAGGSLTNLEHRPGHGLSVYAQDKAFLGKRVTLTFGVRGEFYWFAREIQRTASKDTLIRNNSFTAAVIPGLGLNYQPHKNLNVFAGVHRGFAPPRLKDAISVNGEVYQLNPETSWNYELGSRLAFNDFVRAEITGFYMDFANQVIPVSQSSGGAGAGFVNGGKTRHAGVEMGLSWDISRLISREGWQVSGDVNFTFADSRFNSDRRISAGVDTINVRGNFTPYAPRFLANASVTVETPVGLGIRLAGLYTGAQFGDALNTVAPSANGRIGRIDDYFLMDGSVWYRVPKIFTTLRFSVKNMTNERYIVSRRPQGIRVGLPMWIMGGFEFNF